MTTKRLTNRPALKARIERVLRELPLSDGDIAKARPVLLDCIAFLPF